MSSYEEIRDSMQTAFDAFLASNPQFNFTQEPSYSEILADVREIVDFPMPPSGGWLTDWLPDLVLWLERALETALASAFHVGLTAIHNLFVELVRMVIDVIVGGSRLVFGLPMYKLGEFTIKEFMDLIQSVDTDRAIDTVTTSGLSSGTSEFSETLSNIVTSLLSSTSFEGLSSSSLLGTILEGLTSSPLTEVEEDGS